MQGPVASIVALLVAGVVAAGCGDESESPPAPSEPPASSEVPSGALAQREGAFVGNPHQGEIQAELDKAFHLYNLPANEKNYSRAGSSLVALREETRVPEMEILREAIRIHAPGVALDLPDAFGLAAADLQVRGGG